MQSYIACDSMPTLALEVSECITTIFISVMNILNGGFNLCLWAEVSIPSGTHLAQPIMRAIPSLWIPSALIMNEPVKALKLSPSKKVISIKL
jgi:hypothetical protein